MKMNMLKSILAASSFVLLGGATMAAADDESFSYSLSFDGVTYSYGEHDGKHGKHTWYGFDPYGDGHPHRPHNRFGHRHYSPHRFSHRPGYHPGYHHVHPQHHGYRHAPHQTRYYYRDGSREDITYYDTDDGYGYVYEYEEGDTYTHHSDEVVYYYDYEDDTSGEIHYYYGDGALGDAATDIGTGLVDVTTGLATDVIDGVGYLLFGD